MTRVTRSRQAASSVGETNVKATAKRTISGAVTKKSIGKTRSSVKKVSSQDENAVPVAQITKVTKTKNSKTKGLVLGSKLLSNKDDPLHNTVLTMKSPVLRDRTNTTNELIKVDAAPKVPSKIPLEENKKSTAKRTTRNTKKQSALKTDNGKASMDKYVVKVSKAQTEDHNKNTLPQNEDLLHSKKAAEKMSEKTDINKNLDKSKELLKLSDKSSPETTSPTKSSLKRKKMSMEDVEKLLHQDDDDDDDHENVENHETSDDEETESVHEEQAKKDDQKAKKFFKCKGTEEESKPVLAAKNKPSQAKKGRAAKKTKINDSTFSPKVGEQRQSTKPENKNLRTRVAKDYCETSRLSNSKDEAKKDADKSPESHVPIYKTIRLSQEQKEDEPDEIYEFHASQDDGQTGKKRKKTVKRPAVKRAKKNTNLPFGLAPLPRKKPTKTASKNVQFKVENVNKENTNAVMNANKVNDAKKNAFMSNTESNCVVPDDFPEIGDNTFAEAPTIRIVANEKLEGNDKYRLTSTPSAPKTASTGLKVFAPKTNTSTQPNQQLNTMANHSLIRESMSPIKKINNEFDTGSPWRVDDAFTRVRRLVQSTPQVNRQAPQRLKKPLEHVGELNKKSFGSEETIHLSAAANKSPTKERSLEEMSTIKQDEPRKFGTVISNKSPSKSTSTVSSSNNSVPQRSPAQGTSLQSTAPVNNQQSPAKAISPPTADPNLPVNYKKLDIEDPDISFDNKENISPKSSPKKKIVAPSPFRFERIRSSKRLAAITSASKSPEKASPTKNLEPEPEAGPSWIDKPKALMKQTTLNNFLNLDEMPESANISTPHGIFDDICSTPVNGRKPKKVVEEANVENAFGFDELDSDDAPSVESGSSHVKIATEADVKNSVKGKLFPKARVKSSVPSRISENTVKKTLLKNVLKKKVVEKAPEVVQEEDDSNSSGKNSEDADEQVVPYKESEKDKKKVMLDAISFSDTFDVLSENGEDIQAKVPEEMPLFVDLEPVHFSEPPRKSYNKRKRNVCFDYEKYDSSDDDSEKEKKRAKKKKSKEPHLNKEEKKRMEEWVKNVNKTFDEIEHFDLVVE